MPPTQVCDTRAYASARAAVPCASARDDQVADALPGERRVALRAAEATVGVDRQPQPRLAHKRPDQRREHAENQLGQIRTRKFAESVALSSPQPVGRPVRRAAAADDGLRGAAMMTTGGSFARFCEVARNERLAAGES